MPAPVLTMWSPRLFTMPGALTTAINGGARVTPQNFPHFADGYGSAVLRLEKAGLPPRVVHQLFKEAIQLRRLVIGYGANSDVVRRELLLLAQKLGQQQLRIPSAFEDTSSPPRTNGKSRTPDRPKTLALIDETSSVVGHELARTERILGPLRERVKTLRASKAQNASEKLAVVLCFCNLFLQQKLDLVALRQDLRSFKGLISSPNGVVIYPTAAQLRGNETLQALAERYPLQARALVEELQGFSNGHSGVDIKNSPWLGPALFKDEVAEVEITLPSEARGARHTRPAPLRD